MKTKLMTFLLLGFFAASFSACSDDSESELEWEPETIIPHFELKYDVTEDMLGLMDIEITYMDLEGNKHTEAVTEVTWNKTFTGETLPAKVGYKVEFTLKENVSFDKDMYLFGGGPSYKIYTTQGGGIGIYQNSSAIGSLTISKDQISEALKAYTEEYEQYAWEITIDEVLAENPTIDWDK